MYHTTKTQFLHFSSPDIETPKTILAPEKIGNIKKNFRLRSTRSYWLASSEYLLASRSEGVLQSQAIVFSC